MSQPLLKKCMMKFYFNFAKPAKIASPTLAADWGFCPVIKRPSTCTL